MAMVPDLDDIFEGKFDLTGWEQYSVRDNYVYNNVAISGLRQEAYQRDVDGFSISVGVFRYHGVIAYIAWGLKSAAHCGFHAPLSPEGNVLSARIGCPEIAPIWEGGTIAGFVLDGMEKWTATRGSAPQAVL